MGLLAFGVWWWGVREERLPAQRAGKVGSLELGAGSKKETEDVELNSYLLTPGPVRRKVEGKEIVTSINGRFAGWEEIKGSEDRYLILDAGEGQVGGNRSDGPYFKVRVVFVPEPDKGIKNATQLSVINQVKSLPLYERLRLVGEFDALSNEQLHFFFSPGIWLKAILYRDGVKHLLDEQGVYYVRAINVNEALK